MTNLLRVYDTVEHINVVTGAVLNSVLLYLIQRFSRKDLGEYKFLLTAFAGYDIVLCIAHFLISPKVISFGTTFGIISNCPWENRHITLVYISMFTVPFVLVNVNFLYRYWSVTNPQRLLLFSERYFKLVLFIAALSTYLFWHIFSWGGSSGEKDDPDTNIAREFYRLKYNRTIEDGWILMDFWKDGVLNVRPLINLITTDSLMISSLSIVSTLGSLTFYHIHQSKVLSSALRSFQIKVLTALCAQTFVPFVFVYFPYFCVGTLPFFGLSHYYIADPCTMLTSCFPTWDAVVIILLMKDYREGLLTLICWRKSSVTEVSKWKSSSSAVNSSGIHH